MFFQAFISHVKITIPKVEFGSPAYQEILEQMIKETDFIDKLKWEVIFRRFSQMIDCDPILTHKDAFNCLLMTEFDPLNRLKHDDVFRGKLIAKFNVDGK